MDSTGDLRLLYDRHDVRLVEADQPSGVDGLTVSAHTVVINGGLDPRQRRFVLAHEFAHILVRRGLAPWVRQPYEELFADEFATALLVPPDTADSSPDVLASAYGVARAVVVWALARRGNGPAIQIVDGLVVCRRCGFRDLVAPCACVVVRRRCSLGTAGDNRSIHRVDGRLERSTLGERRDPVVT